MPERAAPLRSHAFRGSQYEADRRTGRKLRCSLQCSSESAVDRLDEERGEAGVSGAGLRLDGIRISIVKKNEGGNTYAGNIESDKADACFDL